MSNSNGLNLDELFRRGLPRRRCQPSEQKALARFWSYVSKSDDCWNWTGLKTVKGGYGKFSVGSREVRSHVMSYALEYGSVPKGMCVLHKCDNVTCVRPDHLFLGTEADNNRDSMMKGHKRGRKPLYDPDLKAVASNIYLATRSPKRTSEITGLPISCVREIVSNHRNRVRFLVMLMKNNGMFPPEVLPVEQARLALEDYAEWKQLQAEAIKLEEGL